MILFISSLIIPFHYISSFQNDYQTLIAFSYKWQAVTIPIEMEVNLEGKG